MSSTIFGLCLATIAAALFLRWREARRRRRAAEAIHAVVAVTASIAGVIDSIMSAIPKAAAQGMVKDPSLPNMFKGGESCIVAMRPDAVLHPSTEPMEGAVLIDGEEIARMLVKPEVEH